MSRYVGAPKLLTRKPPVISLTINFGLCVSPLYARYLFTKSISISNVSTTSRSNIMSIPLSSGRYLYRSTMSSRLRVEQKLASERAVSSSLYSSFKIKLSDRLLDGGTRQVKNLNDTVSSWYGSFTSPVERA